MAYKRQRYESGSVSRKQSSRPSLSTRRSSSSSRGQVSRINSEVPSMSRTAPTLPVLPNLQRISLAPSSSQTSRLPSPMHRNDVGLNSLEPEAEVESREDVDSINEVVMAFEMRDRGAIGCAYYVARDEKLYLVEDIKMADLDIIDTLKLHAQPTVVLISTRSDEKLEEHLSKEAHGIDRSDDGSMLLILRFETLLMYFY